MRLARQRLEVGLLQALVFDAQLGRDAEAAAVARSDRHRARDGHLAGILLALTSDEIDRAAEASGVAGRKQMLGRSGVGLARPAHRFRN